MDLGSVNPPPSDITAVCVQVVEQLRNRIIVSDVLMQSEAICPAK